jgi:hypothetical protein
LTPMRRFATRTLEAVVRRARPGVREWGEAMLREMDFIESDWEALYWAIGSVRTVNSSSKRSDDMSGEQINRVSGRIITGLSALALLTVVTGFLHPRQPEPDEGTGAHIFQLSIALIVPMILLFFVTADWKKPLRNVRLLALPGAVLVLAFGALYYLEH